MIPVDHRFLIRGGKLVNRPDPQFCGVMKFLFLHAGDSLEFCQSGGGKNLLEDGLQFGNSGRKHLSQSFPFYSQWFQQHFMVGPGSRGGLGTGHDTPDGKVWFQCGEQGTDSLSQGWHQVSGMSLDVNLFSKEGLADTVFSRDRRHGKAEFDTGPAGSIIPDILSKELTPETAREPELWRICLTDS